MHPFILFLEGDDKRQRHVPHKFFSKKSVTITQDVVHHLLCIDKKDCATRDLLSCKELYSQQHASDMRVNASAMNRKRRWRHRKRVNDFPWLGGHRVTESRQRIHGSCVSVYSLHSQAILHSLHQKRCKNRNLVIDERKEEDEWSNKRWTTRRREKANTKCNIECKFREQTNQILKRNFAEEKDLTMKQTCQAHQALWVSIWIDHSSHIEWLLPILESTPRIKNESSYDERESCKASRDQNKHLFQETLIIFSWHAQQAKSICIESTITNTWLNKSLKGAETQGDDDEKEEGQED